MPQTKEVHKEYMRKLRGSQKGSRIDGSLDKGSQINDKRGLRGYPAIVYALADPIKRKKLERVSQSLKMHKQDSNVYYGYPGLGGVPFDVVGDLLEATQ